MDSAKKPAFLSIERPKTRNPFQESLMQPFSPIPPPKSPENKTEYDSTTDDKLKPDDYHTIIENIEALFEDEANYHADIVNDIKEKETKKSQRSKHKLIMNRNVSRHIKKYNGISTCIIYEQLSSPNLSPDFSLNETLIQIQEENDNSEIIKLLKIAKIQFDTISTVLNPNIRILINLYLNLSFSISYSCLKQYVLALQFNWAALQSWSNFMFDHLPPDYDLLSFSLIRIPYHPLTALCFSTIACVLFKLGYYFTALRCNCIARDIRMHSLPPDSPEFLDVSVTLNNIGTCLYFLNRFTESLEYFKASLAIMQSHLSSTHPRVFTIKRNITKLENLRPCSRLLVNNPSIPCNNYKIDPNDEHIKLAFQYYESLKSLKQKKKKK